MFKKALAVISVLFIVAAFGICIIGTKSPTIKYVGYGLGFVGGLAFGILVTHKEK